MISLEYEIYWEVYARTKLPRVGSPEHAMMSKVHHSKMQHAQRNHGPKIMACKLAAMYAWLGFSHDADMVLVHEQALDSPDTLKVPQQEN